MNNDNRKISYEYLAGMIDGEGCIAYHQKKDKKTISGFTFAPYMNVTSSVVWHLELLKDNFGGTISKDTQKGFANTGINDVYSLRWSSNEIRELLPRVLPYLILKRKEAVLVLEGLSITKNHRCKTYVQSEIAPRMINICEQSRKIKKTRNNIENNERHFSFL